MEYLVYFLKFWVVLYLSIISYYLVAPKFEAMGWTWAGFFKLLVNPIRFRNIIRDSVRREDKTNISDYKDKLKTIINNEIDLDKLADLIDVK